MIFESINPHTGQVLAAHPVLDAVQLEARLETAQAAYRQWRRTPFARRADLLQRVAHLLQRDNEPLARLITAEMGKHIREARAEVAKCITACTYYAEHGEALLADQPADTPFQSRVVFDPIGAVLAIMPWNFPFWQVFRQATAALTAGNVLLLKHAPNVCGCSLAIESLFREAGCPEGVFQSLVIDVPQIEQVVRHPVVQAVTLTGSERAGASVAALAGTHIKRSILELGGSDAVLVLDDADLDLAARLAVQSRMQNAGQSCIAAKRFLVTAKNADAFTEKTAALIGAIRQGDPLSEQTHMGPLARPDLAEALDAQLQASLRQGARLLAGGQRDGTRFQPTLLAAIRPDMAVFEQETFGPLAAVCVAPDEAALVELANRSRYGLGASLFSQDRDRAARLARDLEAGSVFINGLVRSDVRLPFGGVKKSGYGRELSGFGIRELTNTKTIVVE